VIFLDTNVFVIDLRYPEDRSFRDNRRFLDLFTYFARRFHVSVVPGCDWDSRLPSPTVRQVLERMEKKMSLKDAETALAVEERASNLEAFVTWNAKHFVKKLSIPALTPSQWMAVGRKR